MEMEMAKRRSKGEEEGDVDEIIVEILWRLPVESLLRCRSVCKSWYSLISDPHFVKTHLTFAKTKLLFTTLPKINLKTTSLNHLNHPAAADVVSLDYPYKHPRKSVWIVGSCNGLLCIAIEEDTLFIWNPSTRTSNTLPYSAPKPYPPGCYVLYGFGYQPSSHDYNVVQISCLFKHRATYDTIVNIYSLNYGNWTNISPFPHGIPLDDSGHYSNGALHWAASQHFNASSYSWIIVSLDLATHTYAQISQPAYPAAAADKDLTLGTLQECLCVMCNYRAIRADFWVMKVYGVKDSWTNLVSIPYLTDPGRDHFSVPLYISNEGKILLQFGSNLIVYDSKNTSSSLLHYLDECLEACTYVESLVSPHAPTRSWR